ncbi:MAG: response regulator [Elusimicrobia bacterium]|nr:response regulator [Elusimicrobiota bacterium]
MVEILIAEDMLPTRQLYAAMLGRYDCNITEAVTGKQALDKLKEKKPDLMILDNNMPEMTGYEVLQEMQKDDNLKNLPVVFITAKYFDKDFQDLIKLNAAEFLTKPFTVEILVTAIEKVLKKPLPAKQ